MNKHKVTIHKWVNGILKTRNSFFDTLHEARLWAGQHSHNNFDFIHVYNNLNEILHIETSSVYAANMNMETYA